MSTIKHFKYFSTGISLKLLIDIVIIPSFPFNDTQYKDIMSNLKINNKFF